MKTLFEFLAASFLSAVCCLAAAAQPVVSEVRRDESVLLFPALMYPTEAGSWRGEVRAQVFERESRNLILPSLEAGLGLARWELTSAEQLIFEDRARWLMLDHERKKQVVVRVAGETFDLGKTAEQGQVLRAVTVTEGSARTGAVLPMEVVLPSRDARRFTGEVHLLGATGVSVISDIDDTIKVSVVTNKQELLKNTFTRPFREVSGMAALYRHWRQRDGASFHYVSASPWQLYVPLEEFTRSNAFPAGSFHLKEFRWRDERFLNLFASPEDYKIRTIEPLLQAAPRRRFVLVGDSGERDPEAYGELARRHPEQVVAIFIRELAGESATAPRYQSAFRDVPASRWRLFTDPASIRELTFPETATTGR